MSEIVALCAEIAANVVRRPPVNRGAGPFPASLPRDSTLSLFAAMSMVLRALTTFERTPLCEQPRVRFAGPFWSCDGSVADDAIAGRLTNRTSPTNRLRASKPASHAGKPDKVLRRAKFTIPAIRWLLHQPTDPAAWQDNQVIASPLADDEEWLRRVSLDLHGHIPFWKEIDRFHKDKSPTNGPTSSTRCSTIPAYVRNWTTIWTNLTDRPPDAATSEPTRNPEFFREAFAQNRPWNEIVYDLVSAEGRSDENGAVNYPARANGDSRRDGPRHGEDHATVHGRATAVCPVPQPSIRPVEAGPVLGTEQLPAQTREVEHRR